MGSAGDPDWYPDLGEPWTPSKLYYSVWSRARITSMHEKFLELGLESPYEARWFERPDQDERVTTRVPIDRFGGARLAALRAHATQVDPESPFWFGLPDEVLDLGVPLGGLAAGRLPGADRATRGRPVRRSALTRGPSLRRHRCP